MNPSLKTSKKTNRPGWKRLRTQTRPYRMAQPGAVPKAAIQIAALPPVGPQRAPGPVMGSRPSANGSVAVVLALRDGRGMIETEQRRRRQPKNRS